MNPSTRSLPAAARHPGAAGGLSGHPSQPGPSGRAPRAKPSVDLIALITWRLSHAH